MNYLIFIAPFIFIPGISDFADLPQRAFILIYSLVLLVLWFSERNRIAKSNLYLPLGCFMAWAGISIFYAHNKYEGIITLQHWLVCGLIFFLVLNYKKILFQRLLNSMVYAGLGLAIIGIMQHSGFDLIPQVVKPSITFANKNMATEVITICFLLAVVFYVQLKQRIMLISATVMAVFLVYAYTRTAYVSIAVAMIVFAISLFKYRVKWTINETISIWLAFLLVVGCAFIPSHYSNKKPIIKKQANIEVDVEGYSSIQQRKDIFLNTFEMIKERPVLGFGLGNHKIFYPLYHRAVVVERVSGEAQQLDNVHNDYLQIWSELGIIGMLFIGWFWCTVLVITARLLKDKNIRNNVIAISVAVTGILANAMASFPFHRSIPPFYLMVFFGMLGSYYSTEYFKPRKRMLQSFLCVVLGLFMVLVSYKAVRADQYYLYAEMCETVGNWDNLIYFSDLSYKYNPYRKRILSFTGIGYLEKGKYGKSVKVLSEVIKDYPYHMNALTNIGVAYANIGDNERALKAYNSVLALYPDYYKVYNNMGNVLMAQNKYKEALILFERAKDLSPNNKTIQDNILLTKSIIGETNEKTN